jgi:glycine cleavage system H protein
MEIHYTAEHEWIAVADGVATVGITDHAQAALGDLVFVQLPDVGAAFAKGAVAAVVESVKAASDIYAPLSGTIVEANSATVNDPAVINSDAMGAGWLFKIKLSNVAELADLLDESAYRKITS